MATTLVTASSYTQLSNIPGRAVASARGHHIIVDSPPTLNGPNEELNPVDILLIALGTCATFICETAAREAGIPLDALDVDVAGDFDPRGICGEPVESGIQAFRVRINLSGPNEDQAQFLVESFRKRCPVYGTLSKAAPIEVDVVLKTAVVN
jgi:uncharacterized OsmC-like protein